MKNYFLIGFVGVGAAINGLLAACSEPRISLLLGVDVPFNGKFVVVFLGVLILQFTA